MHKNNAFLPFRIHKKTSTAGQNDHIDKPPKKKTFKKISIHKNNCFLPFRIHKKTSKAGQKDHIDKPPKKNKHLKKSLCIKTMFFSPFESIRRRAQPGKKTI